MSSKEYYRLDEKTRSKLIKQEKGKDKNQENLRKKKAKEAKPMKKLQP